MNGEPFILSLQVANDHEPEATPRTLWEVACPVGVPVSIIGTDSKLWLNDKPMTRGADGVWRK